MKGGYLVCEEDDDNNLEVRGYFKTEKEVKEKAATLYSRNNGRYNYVIYKAICRTVPVIPKVEFVNIKKWNLLI